MSFADKLRREKRLKAKHEEMSKQLGQDTVAKFEAIYTQILGNLRATAKDYQQ
jgi:ESCRT-II complex subunit VPS22